MACGQEPVPAGMNRFKKSSTLMGPTNLPSKSSTICRWSSSVTRWLDENGMKLLVFLANGVSCTARGSDGAIGGIGGDFGRHDLLPDA